MGTMSATPSNLTIDHPDNSINFNSLQPTIRLEQNLEGRTVYAVYVGHKRSSRAKHAIVWARLIPGRVGNKPQGGWTLRLYPADNSGCMRTVEFFNPNLYTAAVWLQNLVQLAWDKEGICLITQEEKTRFVRGVVRLVLEEVAGDELTLGGEWNHSLRRTNSDEREALPMFVKLLFGDHGVQPLYCVSSRAALSPQSTISPGSGSRTDQSTMKHEAEATDDSQASSDEDTSYEDDSDPDADFEPDTRRPAKRARIRSDYSAGAEIVDLTDDTQPRLAQYPSHAARNSDPAPKDTRPDDLLEPTSPSPWHANAHRLIVQPAKEKAVNQIEGLLKDWLAGKLGEDALEESFRESLTDVRLSRQMQDAFVQSKVTMPSSSSRRPSKRTADELED